MKARRIDSTATALVKHARKLGAEVIPINGVIDALVWYRGRWRVVDWKSSGGTLTDEQSKLVARGCKIDFVSTAQQLEDLLLAPSEPRP